MFSPSQAVSEDILAKGENANSTLQGAELCGGVVSPSPSEKECSVLQIIKFALTALDSYFKLEGLKVLKNQNHSDC